MKKTNGILYDVKTADLQLLKTNPKMFWEGVKSIDSYAFYACMSELESIIIPNGVEKIQYAAFQSFPYLTSVVLPDTLKTIGASAFWNCAKLKKINLPDSIIDIGYGAFRSCNSLENVVLPKGLETIEEATFSRCMKLKTITLSKNLKKIDNLAFKSCSSLKYVDIPETVNAIGEEVFGGCSNLRSIRIPERVSILNPNTFNGCEKLTSVSLPSTLTSINYGAFDKCSSLTSIKIPDSVVDIGNFVFSGCSNLKSIEMPTGLKQLGTLSFVGCEKLSSINIPEGVRTLPKEAFHCSGLKSINLPNSLTSIEKYCFRGCSNLKEIKLPPNLRTIDEQAFYNCVNLSSVSIPDGIKKISKCAFENCNNLHDVSISNNIKEFNASAFLNSSIKCVYLTKDGLKITLTQKETEKNADDYLFDLFSMADRNCLNSLNYRKNYVHLNNSKKDGELPFIPPDYVLSTFPETEILNFYKNKNNNRWGILVQDSGFLKLDKTSKTNSLTDLLKIYYAIGGFSNNQAESETAAKYIRDNILKLDNAKYEPENAGEDVHSAFSKLELKGSYSPEFASFFMKYYKLNPSFMVFDIENDGGYLREDYLCAAHNSFKEILKNFPNRHVNGNDKNSLLSPEFVAKHSCEIEYENIYEGNEHLARVVGQYGYSQERFEEMQDIMETVKYDKISSVITAENSKSNSPITFRILDKTDPLGFVLGDITNCCQHLGGVAESCVKDGFLSPNACFIVFEKNDENSPNSNKPNSQSENNSTNDNTDFENDFHFDASKILAQAYTWYDPKTKTVCLDNIEIPKSVLKSLNSSKISNDKNQISNLIISLNDCANSIMKSMKKNGVRVEIVTTGEGYNDLKKYLKKNYELDNSPTAKNPSSDVYSDADSQYTISSYIKSTSEIASDITKTANEINGDLQDLTNGTSDENEHLINE